MPEELIFFAVIILFSIIESIARSRKKKGGGIEHAPPPSDRDRKEYDFEWAQTPVDELPTYDDDPSYDDQPSYDDAHEEPTPAPRSLSKSSAETLLPSDLLSELATVLQESTAQTVRVPKQSPPLPKPDPVESRTSSLPTRRAETRPVPSRSRVPTPRRRGPPHLHGQHPVHLAHAGYGTDPSERPPSEQDGLDPLARFLSEDAKAIRGQLLSRDASALRQAIVLQEVLGKPIALRSDHLSQDEG